MQHPGYIGWCFFWEGSKRGKWGSLSASDPRAKKYGPTCHQRDCADVTEFVTLVRLSSLGQHVGVLALAGYKRRKSALAANPIPTVITIQVLLHRKDQMLLAFQPEVITLLCNIPYYVIYDRI